MKIHGYENSAFVMSDGTLWVWGNGRSSQLGTGETNTLTKPEKILDNVIDVQLSFQRGLALKSDGTVWAWGRNDSGYVGTGNKTNQSTPVQILSNIKKIYAGDGTSAAISNSNGLYMWGSNYYGTLGDGTTSTATSPKFILSNVSDVSVRYNHTAAIVNDNQLYSWGHNCHKETFPYPTYGQGVNVLTPYRWPGYSATAVATTEGNTIFLDRGTVKVAGVNWYGIYGNGLADSFVYVAASEALSNVKEIKTGQYHILALDNNDTLWGWGRNDVGQLGIGYIEDIYRPTEILYDVEYFCTYEKTSGAILKNGDVYAWGNNRDYQLLDKCSSSYSAIPTKIFDGPEYKEIESVRLYGASQEVGPEDFTVAAPVTEPIDAIISSIEWNSSDESIASVNQFGVIEGKTEGTVDITATITSKDGQIWNVSREIRVDKNAGLFNINIEETPQIVVHENIIEIHGSTSLGKISLCSLDGKIIYSNNVNIKDINIEIPVKGIYLLTVNSITKKVLIK